MKSFFNKVKAALKDESAQGATEYILLLVIVVAIALMFRERIMEVVQGKVEDVGGQIQGFGN